VGDDPGSHTYVRMKTNRCRTTGPDSRPHELGNDTTTAHAVGLVRELARLGHLVNLARAIALRTSAPPGAASP
jgi:5,10-methylene-tetrahydrofolate dehydrogenase/methenyl tetrahydrofolate cyclohydrolase